MNTNINTAINTNILIQLKYKHKININNIINIKEESTTCFGSSVPSIASKMCHV